MSKNIENVTSSVTIAVAHFAMVVAAWLLLASPTFAQTDQIYFPAVDNVRKSLVAAINAETVRIDMSAWYLSEHSVSIALVNAFNRGVGVRLIGDRGAIFEIDPRTRSEFYWLASQGVPIRLRENPTSYPEIDHWKATIFKGQGRVAFGSANYTPNQLAPTSSTDYSDETVLFTTDAVLVGAFLTKFDQYWNDTLAEPDSITSPPYFRDWNDACAIEPACSDYRTLYPNPAPMTVSTARLEPDRPTPADLVWGQGPAFNNRLVHEIESESSRVDFVIYRLTTSDVAQALLDRFQAGVPTRLIIEPGEYGNRKWPEFWLTHANLDRLWAAGVPMKQRQHAGLTHMKMLVTSVYATNASSNLSAHWQRDHDYFVSASAKPAIYQAMANRFGTMWNDTAGFTAFVPKPADPPVLSSPSSGAPGVSQAPTLSWKTAAFATSYDVYLGASQASLSLVANVPAQLVDNPPATYSWTPASNLAGSATYFWRVVARTNATVRDPQLVAASSTWSFTTAGTGGGGTVAAPAAGAPFGQVDTPAQNAGGVVGSIGITGWALDDTGVASVKIYRDCLAFDNQANCRSVGGVNAVYIGDAEFVAGARPDVQGAYPTYPNSDRAGWGFLLLTNMLPDVVHAQPFGGQGTLTLYAFATDTQGTAALLGRTAADHTPTSITMANETIGKPFGAIDTPGQGETVSGRYVNFGWVITPDSNTSAEAGDIVVPPDGSTIRVFIDGADAGHVTYDLCRGDVGNPVPSGVYCDDDVADIFGNVTPAPPLQPRGANPTRFRNLDAGRGAIGYFVIDTTGLANGLHTIAWGVADSAGRTEGIGSRYFYVKN